MTKDRQADRLLRSANLGNSSHEGEDSVDEVSLARYFSARSDKNIESSAYFTPLRRESFTLFFFFHA